MPSSFVPSNLDSPHLSLAPTSPHRNIVSYNFSNIKWLEGGGEKRSKTSKISSNIPMFQRYFSTSRDRISVLLWTSNPFPHLFVHLEHDGLKILEFPWTGNKSSSRIRHETKVHSSGVVGFVIRPDNTFHGWTFGKLRCEILVRSRGNNKSGGPFRFAF